MTFKNKFQMGQLVITVHHEIGVVDRVLHDIDDGVFVYFVYCAQLERMLVVNECDLSHPLEIGWVQEKDRKNWSCWINGWIKSHPPTRKDMLK